MEEIRNEVRGLRTDIASLAKDVAELKRLVGNAYGRTSTSGTPLAGPCSGNPFQHHYPMKDGSCACQTPAWARG